MKFFYRDFSRPRSISFSSTQHSSRRGSPSLSGGIPGAPLIIFILLLLIAPRLVFGFFAALLLFVALAAIFIWYKLSRLKRTFSNQMDFFEETLRQDAQSTDSSSRPHSESISAVSYEIDGDTIEVVDAEEESSSHASREKSSRRWGNDKKWWR
ncbi:hypothetical protein MRY87_02810 [bacterium]|nr:hypothetical protein [bacterium]